MLRRLLPYLVLLFVLLLGLAPAGPAQGQLVADSVYTWRGYSREARCRVRLYRVHGSAREARTHLFLVDELAANRGPSTLEDAPYLAEQLGRGFGVAPDSAYFVFHWGAHSFEGAAPDRRKRLFLRATFRRTASGTLGTPHLRLLRRDDLRELTGRAFD